MLTSQLITYYCNDVFQSNSVECIEEDEEQVDIETIEELPQEVTVVHKKTTFAHPQSSKQP